MTGTVSTQTGYLALTEPGAGISSQTAYVVLTNPQAELASQTAYIVLVDPLAGNLRRRLAPVIN